MAKNNIWHSTIILFCTIMGVGVANANTIFSQNQPPTLSTAEKGWGFTFGRSWHIYSYMYISEEILYGSHSSY